MKIAPDTNLLVRIVIRDNIQQADLATNLLRKAEVVAISPIALCELVWVLRRVYGLKPVDISTAIEALLNAHNVIYNLPAVGSGLAALNEGGDFADGLIAYEGRFLGGDTFVSFDKKAVTLIANQGLQAKLLT